MKLFQQDQKKIFEYHLQQQQKQREAKLQIKRLQELEKKNPQEHMLYIQKQFKIKSQQIDAAIKKYKAKQINFDILFSQYSLLKDYYVNVSYALKTYDRQSYKQSIDKIYNTIIDLKKKNQPRKKFKFSRRQQDFGVKSDEVAEQVVIKQNQQTDIPGVLDKLGESIQIKQQGSVIGSYRIVNCKDSQIQLLNKTEILFIKNLTNCTIKAALTKSTVFVDHCTNCTLQISCHQLRIHNTFDTTFKIFVTSKAIIQDCDKVIFTPYSFQYPNRKQDQVQFQRENKQNLWREIQDFNWLKENQKSPHFTLVQ